jgi:hypothetical protein
MVSIELKPINQQVVAVIGASSAQSIWIGVFGG